MNKYAVQYWFHKTDDYRVIIIEADSIVSAWDLAQKEVLKQPRKSIMALNPVDAKPHIYSEK